MSYERDYFLPESHPSAKSQREVIDRIVKAVTKHLKLKSPPPYTFLGFNPTSLVEDLEKTKQGKSQKEIEEIDERIKQIIVDASNQDKLIFDFNDIIKTLVVTNRTVPAESVFGTAFYTQWTALLDFSLTGQFIFGRVSKKQRHGFGIYCFAPLDFATTELESETVAPSELIQKDATLKFIDDIRYTQPAQDQMRKMLQLIQQKQSTGIHLIDSLNQNKQVIKRLKKVGHFGAVIQGVDEFKSEVDISTIFIPVKNVSFIQMVNFGIFQHSRSLDALYILVDALQSFL